MKIKLKTQGDYDELDGVDLNTVFDATICKEGVILYSVDAKQLITAGAVGVALDDEDYGFYTKEVEILAPEFDIDKYISKWSASNRALFNGWVIHTYSEYQYVVREQDLLTRLRAYTKSNYPCKYVYINGKIIKAETWGFPSSNTVCINNTIYGVNHVVPLFKSYGFNSKEKYANSKAKVIKHPLTQDEYIECFARKHGHLFNKEVPKSGYSYYNNVRIAPLRELISKKGYTKFLIGNKIVNTNYNTQFFSEAGSQLSYYDADTGKRQTVELARVVPVEKGIAIKTSCADHITDTMSYANDIYLTNDADISVTNKKETTMNIKSSAKSSVALATDLAKGRTALATVHQLATKYLPYKFSWFARLTGKDKEIVNSPFTKLAVAAAAHALACQFNNHKAKSITKLAQDAAIVEVAALVPIEDFISTLTDSATSND